MHTTHYAYPFQGELIKLQSQQYTILILRSFQKKGLCNSGLKAKSTTFVRNITTIRLRSQFVILKMNINMTDNKNISVKKQLLVNKLLQDSQMGQKSFLTMLL